MAAIALGLVFSTDGEAADLPESLESVSPQPGDLVPPQTTLEIDLEVGYAATILVDGWPISDATFVKATGVYRWTPSPSSPTIQEWTPGEHTVVSRATDRDGRVQPLEEELQPKPTIWENNGLFPRTVRIS